MRFIIAPAKLSKYLLNPAHPIGAAKARFFLGRGFLLSNCGLLEAALLRHPQEAGLLSRVPDPEGFRRAYQCGFAAADGTRPCIRSIWIEDHAGETCRFITAYPHG